MAKDSRTRSRTFTGCKTCRLRHAKCDEARPSCRACQRLGWHQGAHAYVLTPGTPHTIGVSCEGYEPQLFWIADEVVSGSRSGSATGSTPDARQQSQRAPGFRYPLYTEVYRRQMSVQVNKSMRNRSATELLFQLDTKCEKNDLPPNGDAMLGPFSVFDTKAMLPRLDEVSSPPLPALDYHDQELVEEVNHEDWSNLEEFQFGLFSHDFESSLDHLGFQEDPPALANQNLSLLNYLPLSQSGEPDTSRDYEQVASTHDNLVDGTTDGIGDDSGVMHELPLAPPRPFGGREANIPEQAAHLLRYHKQRIMESSSQMQAHRKSPWRILFLPCALETFAEIAIFNSTSHTRSAVFYAILANSAFQIHVSGHSNTSTTSSRWLEMGKQHRTTAKNHLRDALRLEAGGPNQAEYKDLLMAVLACAMTALYDNTHTFMYFLIDAERLIRLRGLATKKSVKVRLLHHMYTHLRIIAESTAAGMRKRINSGNGQFDLITPGTVKLHQFSVPEDSLTQGLDPTREKIGDDGYNDIHLEVQGKWDETLFPNIYGVPESLVTLLSQIISFANNKEGLERIALKSAKVSAAMASHIKTLENTIWSWSLPGPERPLNLVLDSEDGEFLVDQPNTRSMVLAMHQAVLIYFYRRVYNMSAMMLQDRVRKALEYLQPCIDEGVDDQDFAASMSWSAFITGCEAVSPNLQEKALKSILAIENRASIFSPQPASQIVKNIWEQRSRTGDWTLSWPNVM